MIAEVAGWLIDTLVFTGLLIALVLLLRRPVARQFGPQVAYALWALPLLRFVMPPLVLPECLAPSTDLTTPSEPVMMFIAEAPITDAGPAIVEAAQQSIGLFAILLPLWLGGAALFLLMRVRNYKAMRRELLADARPVGEVGKVRLVETPAVASPLAFGVRDKVIALPQFFMAQSDRRARDLAIAHELAHHRGHDLLANFAAQPLLALHWFNPLAWAGWRAMRQDQEAACDARVVAGSQRSDRADYARVIAGFAAGDNRLVLAAPMACPVLGEKSIIHRLRTLSMDETPLRRRRAGLAAIGLAALALPLTASISYSERAEERPAVPAPPVAPAPPSALVPVPPIPPVPAESPDPIAALADPHPIADVEPLAEVQSERGTVVRREREMRAVEEAFAEMERELKSLEDINQIVESAMAEADHAIAEAGHASALAHAQAGQVRVEMGCEGNEPVVERQLSDGRRAILICTDAINAQAAEGLREARRAIAQEEDFPPAQRRIILRQLDAQIDSLSHRKLSTGFGPHFVPGIATPASFAPDAEPACEEGQIA